MKFKKGDLVRTVNVHWSIDLSKCDLGIIVKCVPANDGAVYTVYWQRLKGTTKWFIDPVTTNQLELASSSTDY